MACYEEDEIIVKYLVEHGADINKKDNEGLTPLDVVTYRGHKDNIDIIKYLVEHGAY